MKSKEILRQRLINQQLIVNDCDTVGKLVNWMGAVQAQDYAMSKWAIAMRLNDFTEEDVEAAINAGEIFRVHIMRPTWHFVASNDLSWLMSLTSPNIKRAMTSQNRQIGLNDALFAKSQKVIAKLLADGKPRTREEIVRQLESKKIILDNLQATNVMIYAELDMIVCNGPRRGKQFTYSLWEDRVPQSQRISREEALYKLTTTYFKSHGPATTKDFAWWSGLSKEDVKYCMQIVQDEFISCMIDKVEYYYHKSHSVKPSANSTLLLPPYDEFTIGYANRDMVSGISDADKEFFGQLIFRPVIVYNGKAIGTWRREIGKEIVMEVDFPVTASLDTKRKVNGAITKYRKFLGKKQKAESRKHKA